MGESDKKMMNIVFVDDDEHVLHGLKCMLRDMRHEWNMHFCQTGEEALKLMQAKPFDIIISDMRMPEMDGAVLLAKVKAMYPGVTRIILSGYSEKKMILKTVDSADQFLSKPCKKEELVGVVEQSLATREIFKGREIVLETIAGMNRLPTIPNLYMELKELLESKNSSLKDVSDVIKVDVAMSAKILQLVNSAFFGLRHRIVDIHRAIVYLGVRTIKAVVIMNDVFGSFTEEEMQLFSINDMYLHSVTVSSLARQMAASLPEMIVDDVGMAAMLHDIGKIIFIRNNFDTYKKFFTQDVLEEMPLHIQEKSVLGVTHAEAGSYLMGVWGIPKEVVEAIAKHHGEEKSHSKVVNILRAAEAMVNFVKEEERKEKSRKYFYYEDYLDRLDLCRDWEKWHKKAYVLVNNKEI